MKILTLGPEGTFSHELALKLATKNDEIVLLPTIRSIMAAVERGEGEGIVPIENSEAGGVGETQDGLARSALFITAEMYLPVHHNLASLVPMKKLRVIYAHPQTHEQCSDKIEAWGLPVIHTSSNASSAREAKKTPNAGAILSETAAALYKMPVIVRNTENSTTNTTRFVRIAREPAQNKRPEKCSVLIDPDTDRSGLLHDLLEVFASRGINLSRIESRPSKRGIGYYVFFLDLAWTPKTPEALAALKEITAIKELGCYKKTEVPP